MLYRLIGIGLELHKLLQVCQRSKRQARLFEQRIHTQTRSQPQEEIQEGRQKDQPNMAGNSVKTGPQRAHYTRWRGKFFELLQVHNQLILPYRPCLGIQL